MSFLNFFVMLSLNALGVVPQCTSGAVPEGLYGVVLKCPNGVDLSK